MNPARYACCLLLAIGLAAPRPATAASIFEQIAVPLILRVDPSVRSFAMGGASTADAWDAAPDGWANPALIGYTEGIRYEHADHSEGVFRVRRASLGHAGFGFSTTGRPISGLGELEFEISGLDMLERSETWGVGVSLGRLVTALHGSPDHGLAALTRHFDLALGYAEKRVESVSYGESAHGIVRDAGLLFVAGTPVPIGGGHSAQLEAAYGLARIGYNLPMPLSGDSPAETARDWRNGIALHVEAGEAAAALPLPRAIAAGLAPLLSVSGEMDFVHRTASSGAAYGDRQCLGGEVGLANVLFGRLGTTGEGGDYATWGLGVQLPIGRFAGVRWDRSDYTSADLEDFHRESWTVWVDPLRIAKAHRRASARERRGP